MTRIETSSDGKPKPAEMDRGPFGDVRPDSGRNGSRANSSLPQADVEDRENVSTVKPDDYPILDRATAQPK